MSRKFTSAPNHATTKPPSAGPAARARLKLMPLRVMAGVSSSRGTSSGMIACHAGALSAEPMPSMKLSPSTVHSVVMWRQVRMPSAPAASSIQTWEKISSLRRSTISASAPAGSARKNIGRLEAVWISETISGDFESEVISHAAPTFCIQVPRLEASAAIQSAKNTRRRSGAHARHGRGRAIFMSLRGARTAKCYKAGHARCRFSRFESQGGMPRPRGRIQQSTSSLSSRFGSRNRAAKMSASRHG